MRFSSPTSNIWKTMRNLQCTSTSLLYTILHCLVALPLPLRSCQDHVAILFHPRHCSQLRSGLQYFTAAQVSLSPINITEATTNNGSMTAPSYTTLRSNMGTLGDGDGPAATAASNKMGQAYLEHSIAELESQLREARLKTSSNNKVTRCLLDVSMLVYALPVVRKWIRTDEYSELLLPIDGQSTYMHYNAKRIYS